MSSVKVPASDWKDFLDGFTRRHHGRMVRIETHDAKTEETVISRSMELQSVDFDTEDEKNPRINVIVRSGLKEIKHIFFRPSHLTLYLSERGADEGLEIESINTVTNIRFRAAASGLVGDAA